MTDLPTGDQSMIGRALGKVLSEHGQVSLKDQKPVLRPWNQPEATRQFLDLLRAEGLDIVRVEAGR